MGRVLIPSFFLWISTFWCCIRGLSGRHFFLWNRDVMEVSLNLCSCHLVHSVLFLQPPRVGSAVLFVWFSHWFLRASALPWFESEGLHCPGALDTWPQGPLDFVVPIPRLSRPLPWWQGSPCWLVSVLSQEMGLVATIDHTVRIFPKSSLWMMSLLLFLAPGLWVKRSAFYDTSNSEV